VIAGGRSPKPRKLREVSYQIRVNNSPLHGLRPPMEVRPSANHLRHRLSRETALDWHVLQGVEILKVTICQGFVGQWPQPFRWLQLRRVGRQKVQVHPGRLLHLGAGMPTSPVEHQEHLLRHPGPHRLGKRCERDRERGNRHGWQQQPHGPARRGVHKGIEVTPLVTVLDDRLRPLPAAAPHAPPYGLETQAVLMR
jgi:hypothetical protein